ncbi:MAG: NADP-dependent oxidoreductase [Phycisphaerae bacterium]
MAYTNHQILLKSRPAGEPTAQNFELVERPVQSPAEGQVLRRTLFLSLDPYMRGRMNAGRSYVDPVEVGGVMCGGTVSQVVESKSPAFAAGDIVLGYDGWQEFGLDDGSSLRKIEMGKLPLSYALGVLGMPGMTAYVGMLDIGRPKAGETVVVSAASGAVGSVAGQIAKIKGCRVVGSAGSDAKCLYVTKELGFDACFNYKTEPMLRALKRACPAGIDVYFENVGGPMLEAVLRLANVGARIPLIGLISQYNATELVAGPNLMPVLVKRITIRGMIVGDHASRRDEFLRDMGRWLAEGKIKYRETVVEGLAAAPKAFIGLFHGENFGKLIVKVAS